MSPLAVPVDHIPLSMPDSMTAPLPLRAVLAALGLMLAATGCAVERSSLSIDSNSRSPWLGLQFAPPKSKEPAYHRPIAKQKADDAKVALAVDIPKTETKWSDWLNPLPQRVSQPLPRTEPDAAASVDTDSIEF